MQTFYEGLRAIRTSSTPARSHPADVAGLGWVSKTKGARRPSYLLAPATSGRAHSNKIARKHIEGTCRSGKVVGEEYFPLGNTQFNSVINKIKLTKPDMIYAIIVGGSNVAFYKQLKAAGIDLSKQTLLTISVTEDEIDGIGGENIAGAFACMKCTSSRSTMPTTRPSCPRSKEDVGREDRDWRRDAGRLSRPMAVELTVEKAGSFDIDKVAAASPGVEFRVRRKATSASTKTITSGRRRASARPRPMVSTNWSARPPISSGPIRSRRAISETAPLADSISPHRGVDKAHAPRSGVANIRGAGPAHDGRRERKCSATIRLAISARSLRCRVSPWGSSCFPSTC